MQSCPRRRSALAALERPQNEVEACCTQLSRREQFVSKEGPIVWPDGTVAAGFRFHHTLYQEVLYDRLPIGHQVQLHRRIAEREEAGYGKRAGEVATELAHHYSFAKDKNKAIHYSRLAGERAVVRGSVVEAESHYRNALKLLYELPELIDRDRQELALQLALGGVLWSSRSWSHPEATRAYARAQELAEKLGETTQIVTVLLGRLPSALGSGQFKLAQELGERMLGASELSKHPASLCAAHTFLGQALIWRGQYVEGQKHLEMGSSYDEADQSELGLTGIESPALAAIVTLLLGFPNRARQLMNDAFRRSERCDNPFWVGLVHMWGGMLGGLLSDGQACLEHAQALRSLGAKQPAFAGLADVNAGRALMLRGSWEEGVGYLRKAIAFHKAVGLTSQLMWAKLDEVEFFASQGEVDDALALIADALAYSEELAQIRSPALRQRADLLAQSDAEPSAISGLSRRN